MFDNLARNEATPEPPPPKKVLKFDKEYVLTLPGLLKLGQLMCNIIGFICIKVSSTWLSAIFFNIVYWVGNIITLFLFIVYMIHLVEKYDHWPWMKYDFFFCGIMTAAYIVCFIFALTTQESVGYAVGFFGLCAAILYGFDGFLKYKGWKRGLPAQ